MPVFGKASKTSEKSHVKAPDIAEPKIPELDLSHLTQDEIAVIQHVLQKQKLFEKQTENKRIMIENQIRQHETRITNNIKKHLDLRLCRLCFYEKFGDGIGRVCHDCRRRVCYHCGSFYKPIESFSVEVKAKWRCRLCSLKREFLCMTGNWYHGDKARPLLDATTLKSVEVVSDKEESDKSHNRNKSCAFHSSGVKSDTETLSTLDPYTQRNRRKQFYHRRPNRRPEEENLDMRYDPQMDDPRRRKRPYCRRRRRPGVISSKNQGEVGRESSDTDGESFHARYPRRLNDSYRYPRPKEGYNPQSGSPDSGLEMTASDYHLHQQQQAITNSKCSSLWQRRRSRSVEVDEGEETPQIPSIRIERGSEKGSSEMELKEVEYVLLRKDFNDRSVRTRGFGMELISGKMRPDGTLVTVVTRVVAGGPAHVQGNLKSGDQILEWNGHNLLDKTFEDACCILSEECDILKILVMRSRHHSRHNSVDRNRPMSLVDTEITARRKTISRSLRNQVNTDQYRRIFHVDNSTPRRKISPARGSPATSPVQGMPPVQGATSPVQGLTSPQSSTSSTYLLAVSEHSNNDSRPTEVKMSVTGEIRLSLLYKIADRELVVHTQEAKGIQVRHTTVDPQLPNPYIKIDMLPHRRESIRQRTATVDASLCPVWNKVFVYSNMDENNIDALGLEFTLWDDIPKRSNIFMGEVLLDLADCDLTGHSQWYNLVEHDENNGPLPKSSPAEVRKTSPCFTRGLPSMPAHDKVKELWENGYLTLRSQGNRSGSDTSLCSARSGDEHWNYERSVATTSMPSPTVIKQLTGARPKIKLLSADTVHEPHGLTVIDIFRPRSSTLPISSLRRSASDRQPTVKNQAKTILRATNSDASLNIQQKSKGLFRRRASSFRRTDSTSSDRSYDSVASIGSTDSENFITTLLSQTFEDDTVIQDDEPSGTPEGPGQAKLQNNGMRVCGYIMLDMAVSKGYLEVLIVKVHGLQSSQSEPIDTYVKTYLRDFKKKLQKKKTRVIKKSTNPVYMQKLTYSACDIDRRILQVGVWKKGSGIETNKQLGETRIHLDKCSLDHMEHTKGWYTLYPALAFARSDSVESQASI